MNEVAVYSEEQVKSLAVKTARWRGWDLVQLRTRRAPVPWRMDEVASSVLTGRETVLDAGCGNGRLLALLAERFVRGIGIDVSRSRIERARLALPMKLRMRVHFTRGSAHAVPAPNETFQLVLSRHAPLFPEEIDRVLAPGGVLITQQIGDQNARAIHAVFDEARGPLPQEPFETSILRGFSALNDRGYKTLRKEQYDVPFVFADAASMLFWLQAVPVPGDFDIERDAATVGEILRRIATPNGIVTNEHRHLLVMQKPA